MIITSHNDVGDAESIYDGPLNKIIGFIMAIKGPTSTHFCEIIDGYNYISHLRPPNGIGLMMLIHY